MKDNLIEAEDIIQVQFYDCDPMNIVWHGNYVKYFEVIRCKLLDQIGYNYLEMAEGNYAWPIVDMRVKYIKPLNFGQKMKIKATLVEYENRLKIKYLITDLETDEIITKGFTIQMAVDMVNQKSCFISPEILIKKIEEYHA